MIITASVDNTNAYHKVVVSTNDSDKQLTIPPKEQGMGSSVNGGELLFLALATCYCNDLYREAAKRQMVIKGVQVSVSGKFGREGEPASEISYTVAVQSDHSIDEVNALVNHVDSVAEVHNTLRQGVQVKLSGA